MSSFKARRRSVKTTRSFSSPRSARAAGSEDTRASRRALAGKSAIATSFRENCTINRGTTKDQLVTKIGSDNLFMTGSHVGHDCVIGSHCVFANYGTLGGHVLHRRLGAYGRLRRRASVLQGRRACVHREQHRGDARDVPPLRHGGRPSGRAAQRDHAEGLKRRGFSPDQIRNIREAYRVLYRSGMKLVEATEELTRRVQTQAELKPFVDFLTDSTPRRGAGGDRAMRVPSALAHRCRLCQNRWRQFFHGPVRATQLSIHRPRRRRDLRRQPRRQADRSAAPRQPNAAASRASQVRA